MRQGPLSRQEAERLVETATAAPSMHNLQPWRFVARLPGRVIEIYADPARALQRADSRGRAVHIACGAALFNLRLAIAHAGAEPIARLLPTARDPLLLAAVRIGGPRRPRPNERDLYAAIHAGRARSGVRPFPGNPPPDSLLAAMAEAAALEGAWLRILDRAQSLRLLQSMAAAERSLRADPGYLSRLAEYTPRPPDPPYSPHHLGGGHLAMLATRSDDRASWLRAGQALQRVLLLAAHHGFPASPLTPVPEPPEIRPRQDPKLGHFYPEMLLRLGPDPAGGASRATARRPVGSIMRVIGPIAERRDEGPLLAPPPALPAQSARLLSSK